MHRRRRREVMGLVMRMMVVDRLGSWGHECRGWR
jgi:hypothetical protein